MIIDIGTGKKTAGKIMINKIDELINHLDPEMKKCECCNQWKKQINFTFISSDLFHYFFLEVTII
jgi:hypothetical protein